MVLFPVTNYGKKNKESACNAGGVGLIPGLGRSPGEGNDNPMQCSYLGNLMDRGAWWAAAHGVTKELDLVTKQQHTRHCILTSG